jgi:hypothetical protein
VVLCRVDASVQPVVAGDLLVASRMVGHACRPAAVAAPGALLGKALAPLAGGQGLVPVLLGRG